jgi:hypothetical protein
MCITNSLSVRTSGYAREKLEISSDPGGLILCEFDPAWFEKVSGE